LSFNIKVRCFKRTKKSLDRALFETIDEDAHEWEVLIDHQQPWLTRSVYSSMVESVGTSNFVQKGKDHLRYKEVYYNPLGKRHIVVYEDVTRI